ncbi:PEGA domain-containing protein [candidate division KSB1 bacterium]|nr:PEGA domain-containing protein [candidate division KSB1 bacterium]
MKSQPYILLLCIGLAATLGAQTQSSTSGGFYITSYPIGATIFLEKEIIGKTPCHFPHDIAGTYRLLAEKAGYESWSVELGFGQTKIDSIAVRMQPLKRSKALVRSLIMPGWGQAYSQQPVKSRILLSTQTLSLLAVGWAYWNYDKSRDRYEEQLQDYRQLSKTYSLEAAAWRDIVQAHDQLNKAHNTRQAIVIAAAALYTCNLLDNLFFFPRHDRQIEFVSPGRSFGTAPSLGFSYKF